MKPRKEVVVFSEAMERRLREHDDKMGWSCEEIKWLMGMANSNLSEATRLEKDAGDKNAQLTALIDCANYCMMAFDILTSRNEIGL